MMDWWEKKKKQADDREKYLIFGAIGVTFGIFIAGTILFNSSGVLANLRPTATAAMMIIAGISMISHSRKKASGLEVLILCAINVVLNAAFMFSAPAHIVLAAVYLGMGIPVAREYFE